jgi:chromosome segregation ATPase
MPQALKIGNSVYQVDDASLAVAVDQTLTKNDSLINEIADLKLKLDAAEAAKATVESALSETKTSLNETESSKVKLDAEVAALQTKLDAATKKNKEWEDKIAAEGAKGEDEEEANEKRKSKKMDSDEIASYCKELLTVVNEVSPSLKKVDSAFEPDFAVPALEYKARFLKTIETLPAEAKSRIDSQGSDRDAFVEHLYLALKPQPQTTATTKADEGTQQLADAINQNRQLTLDAGDKKPAAKEDSPTMKARKERQLSGYKK